MSSLTAEVRTRGEITIPQKIRKAVQLEKGESLEFIPLGENVVLLMRQRLDFKEARAQIKRILKQTEISPKKVLEGLNSSRQEVFEKHYGK